MYLLSPRQTDIVVLAKSEGRVSVEGLADRFNVTPQTIRKDLNDLCERGVLQRYHGGAILASGTANLGYEARRKLATEEKRRIGLKAASLIPDSSSLLINIGTTTEQVAAALRGKHGLLVITNNMNVANILQGYEQIEIIVAGGVVRHLDGGVVGEAAVDFIRQFKVDYAVIGTSAIDEDGTLLDFDYREVKVAQAIINCARRSILVADSMKFERTAPGAYWPYFPARLFRDRHAASRTLARAVPRQRGGHRDRRRGLIFRKSAITFVLAFKRRLYEPDGRDDAARPRQIHGTRTAACGTSQSSAAASTAVVSRAMPPAGGYRFCWRRRAIWQAGRRRLRPS